MEASGADYHASLPVTREVLFLLRRYTRHLRDEHGFRGKNPIPECCCLKILRPSLQQSRVRGWEISIETLHAYRCTPCSRRWRSSQGSSLLSANAEYAQEIGR